MEPVPVRIGKNDWNTRHRKGPEKGSVFHDGRPSFFRALVFVSPGGGRKAGGEHAGTAFLQESDQQKHEKCKIRLVNLQGVIYNDRALKATESVNKSNNAELLRREIVKR